MLQYKNVRIGKFHPVCQALTSIMNTLNIASLHKPSDSAFQLYGEETNSNLSDARVLPYVWTPRVPHGENGSCGVLFATSTGDSRQAIKLELRSWKSEVDSNHLFGGGPYPFVEITLTAAKHRLPECIYKHDLAV